MLKRPPPGCAQVHTLGNANQSHFGGWNTRQGCYLCRAVCFYYVPVDWIRQSPCRVPDGESGDRCGRILWRARQQDETSRISSYTSAGAASSALFHLAAGVVGVAGERETFFAGCQFRRCISLCKANGQKNKTREMDAKKREKRKSGRKVKMTVRCWSVGFEFQMRRADVYLQGEAANGLKSRLNCPTSSNGVVVVIAPPQATNKSAERPPIKCQTKKLVVTADNRTNKQSTQLPVNKRGPPKKR